MGNKDLPQLRQADVIKVFIQLGCVELGHKRGNGSHRLVRPPSGGRPLTIPSGQVKRTLLGQQIKQAGFTNEQFVEAWRNL